MNILGIIASSKLAAASDFESIATVTVGSGGSSSVDFTSIPGTYTHLQVRMMARTNRGITTDYLEIRFNSDGNTNYDDHYLYGNGSATAAGADVTQAEILINRFTGNTATASIFGVGITDILDYANTNKYKTLRHLGGADLNGSGQVELSSGLWRSTSAITSITINPGGGTSISQYSHFALYGIKGA